MSASKIIVVVCIISIQLFRAFLNNRRDAAGVGGPVEGYIAGSSSSFGVNEKYSYIAIISAYFQSQITLLSLYIRLVNSSR